MGRIFTIKETLLCFSVFIMLWCQNIAAQPVFNLNGTTTNIGNDCYQLTANTPGQGGSMFSGPINLNQPFNAVVRLNFGCNDGGADGIVFLFSTSNTALGLTGGGIGYEGITPSFAVEFDTWQNGNRADPVQDHVAIISNGSNDHAASTNLAGPINMGNIEDCVEHCVEFDWDPNTQVFEVIYDGSLLISYTGNIVNTIFGGNPNVFWGFTASTGAATNTHTVCIDIPQITPMQDITICEGASAQLQADPSGDAYSWAPDPTLSATTISNPVATPTVTTQYNVTISFTCGSTATDDVTVFVDPAPVATASNDGPACVGDQVTLFATGGTSYSWSGPNFSSAQQNPVLTNVTLANEGVYMVTVTDANGCTATASTFVEINPPPLVAIFEPGPLCSSGGPTLLNAQPPGGIWGGFADANGFIDPNLLGPGAYPVTYTYTDVNGCTNDDDILVVILPPPNVTINPAGPFCETDPPQLITANPPGGTFGGVAGPSGIIDPAALGPGFHTVVYFYTDPLGCVGGNQITIEVLPAPTVTIAPVDPICEGDSPQSVVAVPPGGIWTGAVDPSGTIDPGILGAGSFAGTYIYVSPGGCVDSTSVNFTIEPVPTTSIDSVGIICETAPPFPLTGNPAGGNWLGDVSPSGVVDPATLGPGMFSASYIFANANNCADTSTLTFSISAVPEAMIDPVGPFCENEPAFTLTANPAGGTWGGVANANGEVDPSMLGTGTFTASYSIIDSAGCTDTAFLSFEVVALPDVSITAAGPFCEDEAAVTLSGSPPGGIWEGAADASGQFDPGTVGVGNHTVTYQFTDGNGCTDSTEIIIEVNEVPEVTIDPAGPFCENESAQALGATPAGGQWQGAADMNGIIDPATLGPGIHQVIYLFSSADSCANSDTLLIEVFEQPEAVITGTDTLCEGSGNSASLEISLSGAFPIELTYEIDNIQQPSVTSSGSVYFLDTSDEGIYTISSIVDANNCTNTGSGIAAIVVADAPEIVDLEINCNPGNTTFTVSFELINGDSSTYQVTGTNGGLSSGSPFIFTSDPIPNGQGYTFQVWDAFGCDTVNLSGSFSCDCITQVGTMDTTLVSVCDPDSASVIYNPSMEVNDGNDLVSFVLHTSSGPFLGNVIATSTDPQFGFDDTTMDYGVTYYISAVMGNEGIPGLVDLNDPCLSVATGTPVIFQPPVLLGVNFSFPVCRGDSGFITFLISGNGPFDLTYTDGTSFFDLEDIQNGHTEILAPDSTTLYNIVSLSDNSNPTCLVNNIGVQNIPIEIIQPTETTQSASICQGDSLFLQGDFQNLPGTYVDTLTGVEGCDSIVFTNLIVNPVDTTLFFETNCDPAQTGVFTNVQTNQFGCDSVIITTIDLVNADTTLLADSTCDAGSAGVFTTLLTNQQGCDSLIIETVSLILPDTTFQTAGDCDPANIGTFSQTFIGTNGCDSIVITEVMLILSDTTNLNSTNCDPGQAGIFTTLLTNQQGCDSLIIETVEYTPPDTTLLSGTTCLPSETGVFTSVLTNQFGCDSVLIETISLLPSDTLTVENTTCDPNQPDTVLTLLTNQFGCDSLVIETFELLPSDTTFTFSSTCNPNQAGVIPIVLTNQFGCDSTVLLTIQLLESDTTLVSETTCEPDEAGIDSTLLINQDGCDSLVITTTNLVPADTTQLFETTCDPNLAGVFTNLLTNQQGCDSLVIETVDLLPSDTTQVSGSTCNPGQAGVFLTLLTNQFGCDSLVVETIDLLPSDTTNLSGNTCDPSQAGVFSTLLTNQFGCDSLVIETIDLLPTDTTILQFESCNPQDTGIIEQLLVNQFGCDSLLITQTQLAPPSNCQLSAEIQGSDVPCNEDTGTITITINDGQPPYDYSWTGTGMPATGTGQLANMGIPVEIDGFTPGIYTFQILSFDGLIITLQVEVFSNSPASIAISIDTSYNGFDLRCDGIAEGQISAEILSGGSPPFSYGWSTGQSTPQLTGLSAGQYEVTVTDSKACESIASTILEGPPPIEIMLETTDLDCSGTDNGQISIFASGGVAPFEYRLNENEGSNNDIFNGLSSGDYSIEVIDANNCSGFIEATLSEPQPVTVELGEYLYIKLGETIDLTADINLPLGALDTVIWEGMDSLSCPGCPVVEVTPDFTTDYFIEVLAKNGCEASDQTRVYVDRRRNIYIPNAFSPNGDGDNDAFTAYGGEDAISIRTFLIYDRWGDLVFEGANIPPGMARLGWNGTVNGQPLDPAVFVYYIEVVFFDGHVEQYSGDITLIR